MMGNAVAVAAMHRHRGRLGQDLHLDLRQAVHHINPSFAWKPTLAGEFPSIALLLDNPFALIPYRTRDGRTVMASAVCPHQAAKWCRFLNVSPDYAKVAEVFTGWDAFELEEAAIQAGLPECVPQPRGVAGSSAWSGAGRSADGATGVALKLRVTGSAVSAVGRTLVPARKPDSVWR